MLGLGSLARKVFGTPNDRKIKAARPLVAKVNALEAEFSALTDDASSPRHASCRSAFRKAAKRWMPSCRKPLPTAAKPRNARLACGPLMCS